jgi:uncharacterized membrane protein (UPF0127 family)
MPLNDMRRMRASPAPARLARLPSHRLPGGLVVLEAATAVSRFLGLAGLDDLPADLALLLPRCRSVHTFGMRFAIDVAFLNREGDLVRLVGAVPRGRVVTCRAARAVMETAAGHGARFLAARAALVD